MTDISLEGSHIAVVADEHTALWITALGFTHVQREDVGAGRQILEGGHQYHVGTEGLTGFRSGNGDVRRGEGDAACLIVCRRIDRVVRHTDEVRRVGLHRGDRRQTVAQ